MHQTSIVLIYFITSDLSMTKIGTENYIKPLIWAQRPTIHPYENKQQIKAITKNGNRIVYSHFYLRGNIIWGPACGVKKVSTL